MAAAPEYGLDAGVAAMNWHGGMLPRVMAAVVIVSLAASCVPLLPLITSALGGGPAGKSQQVGPFAGAPSAAQNARPADSPISDVLAGVDDRIRPSCTEKLPPPEPDPASGCAMRPTCLPGSEQPIRLRICARTEATVMHPAAPAGQNWGWDDAGAY